MILSRSFVSIAATVILFSGVLSLAVPIAFAEEPPLELVVKPGDTLNELCKQYLQDPGLCMEIARFNLIKDPDRIEPGEKILIPYRYLRIKPSQPMTGTVTFLKGAVTIREKDAAQWHPLSLQDPVLQGSRVRTGPDGSAELSFEDKSSLLIRPNTELDVTAIQRESGGFVKRFFLSIGRIVSKTLRDAGVSSKLEIRTETAVAGTRGTRFGITVLEDRTTRAEVQEGTIGVSAMGKEVEVREGEGTIVKQGMPPEQPSRLLPRPVPADLKQQYTVLPVAVQFGRVDGAQRYRAALSRDRDGRDVVIEQVLSPGEPFQTEGLADGTYYLFAKSIDEKGLEGLEGEPAVLHVALERQPPAPQPVPEVPRPPERTIGEAILTIIFVIAAILI